jgi:hypothetical protein
MHRTLSSVVLVAVAVASLTAVAAAPEERHCAVFLAPAGPGTEPGTVATTPQDLGCYPTYAQAVAAGTGGAVVLSSDATPATLTQSALDRATPEVLTGVLIGTEWVATGFNGSSNSYFAASTCSSSTTWEMSYVGDMWNDNFESGKGFGSCDHNRKFHDSNFGGTSVLCTPNCSDYGALRNEVSSLRWRV